MRLLVRGVIFVLLLCALVSDGKNKGHIYKLGGYMEKDHVKLIWMLKEWPKDLIGFQIKRRHGGMDHWQELSKGTICPEISAKKDWAAQGLNDEQVKKYQKVLKEYLKKDQIALTSKAKFLSILKEQGVPSGARLFLKNDYNYAILLGFGYIDNTIQPGGQYLYGLFPVTTSGISEKPAWVYHAQHFKSDSPQLDMKATSKKVGDDIVVDWSMPYATMEKVGYLEFILYFRNGKQDKWHRVAGRSRSRIEDCIFKRSYQVNNANPWQSYEFKICLNNMFQQEVTSKTIKYNAPDVSSLKPVALKSVTNNRGQSTTIRWQTELNQRKFIKGYYIERKDAGASSYKPVSALLGRDQQRYNDMKLPKENETYGYRLVTIDVLGKKLISPEVNVFAKGPERPGQPRNLSAEFLQKDGKNFIRLTWQAPRKANKIKGYRLYSDDWDGEMRMNGSIGLIKGTEVTLPYDNKGGYAIRFAIDAFMDSGESGAKAETVVKVPRLTLEKVDDLDIEFNDDGNVILSWNYPAFDDLTGFRIYMNGACVWNEKQVPGNVRGWVIRDYQMKKDNRIDLGVQVVNPYCESSLNDHAFYLPHKRPNRSIPAPSWVRASIEEKDGKRFLDISWPSLDLERYKLRGYMVQLAYNSKKYGDFRSIIGLKRLTKTEFLYELPDKYKEGTLYIRVAGTDYKQPGLFKTTDVRIF